MGTKCLIYATPTLSVACTGRGWLREIIFSIANEANMKLSVCYVLLLTVITDAQIKDERETNSSQVVRFKQQESKVTKMMNASLEPDQQTAPQDKAALKAFYKTTNGENWQTNTGWLKGDPCRNRWYGLECSESGRVLSIKLIFNNMSGFIPPDITKMDRLQVLRLFTSDLKGSIPPGVFSMKELQELDIHNNQISGELPGVISMPSIVTIALNLNALEGTIPHTWNTPNLQNLLLSTNQFHGPMPPSIGNLTKLNTLHLFNNILSGNLPVEYGQLTNLQNLWLFNNQFKNCEIPQSWSGMHKLQNFMATGFGGDIPSWIGTSWSELATLSITDGTLTGSFPKSLCSLPNIQRLYLSNNSLSGRLPSCICSTSFLHSLTDCYLNDNPWTCPLPLCIHFIRPRCGAACHLQM